MRSDYALYTVAIIFFILTAISAFVLVEGERQMWVITTTVLGLLFIGLGYSQRPKTTAIETPCPPAPITPTTVTEEETKTLTATTLTFMALTEVKGIGKKRAEQLEAIGIDSPKSLAKTSAKDLASELKISPKITKKWIEDAKRFTEKS